MVYSYTCFMVSTQLALHVFNVVHVEWFLLAAIVAVPTWKLWPAN